MTLAPPPSARARAQRRTVVGALREVWESNQILANMIRRDFSAKHKNSFFGMAWSLVNPMLLVAIFSFVFYILGARAAPNRPYPFALFFFAGLVLWNFFSSGLQSATGSVVGGRHLIQKVYFPRKILPMSQV